MHPAFLGTTSRPTYVALALLALLALGPRVDAGEGEGEIANETDTPTLELEDERGQPLSADVEAPRVLPPAPLSPIPVISPPITPRPLPPAPQLPSTPPQETPTSESGISALPIRASSFAVDAKDVLLARTPKSVQEALRGLPGVHVRAEATGGLIPNIGFRGLNPDRSESVLILEDGVPASLAPYAVNASYFMPPLERLQSIDVLQGPGQIVHGPHTVGGVLNLRTHRIPETQGGLFRLSGGSDGYATSSIHYGGRDGPTGALVSALYKRGDGYRDRTDFDVADIMVKVSHDLGPRTTLLGKVGYYRQHSDSTYLGLTEAMFREEPHQNPARHDAFDVEWLSGLLRLTHRVSCCMTSETSLYYGSGYRNWNRQDFARNHGFAAPPANTVATAGDPAVDGGAIYLRASFGSRDRTFRRVGVEERLHGTWWLSGLKHEFQIGARYHDELFINSRHNRVHRHAASFTRDRDTTDLWAIAGYVHDTVHFSNRVRAQAGVRMEHYAAERRFSIQGGSPVDISGESENTEVLPAFGVELDLDRAHTVHAGVHRGFAPPRTSQSIDSTGTDLDLDAERSWNYEVGVRSEPRDWLRYSVTGFLIDFENQVVPANESGGASTTNTNAGETRNVGVEFSAALDLLAALRSRGARAATPSCAPKLWLDTAWTWIETENVTSGGIFEGKELPYAPNWVGHVGLRAELPRYGLTASLWATYVGEQFADQANTVASSADGTLGEIPDHWVLDATLRWRLPRTQTSIFANVGNLLDEDFITSRAPRGIFAGARRHVVVGVEMDL